MQEINYEFYQAFVKEYYGNENKCTSDLIAKAILLDKNRGIVITLKNGNKYTLNASRILE